jgi:hypothetical protein
METEPSVQKVKSDNNKALLHGTVISLHPPTPPKENNKLRYLPSYGVSKYQCDRISVRNTLSMPPSRSDFPVNQEKLLS